MARKLLVILCATVIVLLGSGVLAGGSAGASSASRLAKGSGYSGAAPGSVTCNLSAQISFSPTLTLSGGGTSPSKVKGKLSGCTASTSGLDITSGSLSGSFASSPLDCVGPAATGATGSFTVSWKGDFNGTVGGVTYSGKAKFSKSAVTSGTEVLATGTGGDIGLSVPGEGNTSNVTGSFTSTGKSDWLANAYSTDTSAALSAACNAKGIKKLTLTGPIAIGIMGQPTVTNVNPDSGTTEGGTPVTITGTNFAAGSGTTFDFEASNPATEVDCTSSTTCTATTPAGPAGTLDVTATVGIQTSAANPPDDQFSYETPPPTWSEVPLPNYLQGATEGDITCVSSSQCSVAGSDTSESDAVWTTATSGSTWSESVLAGSGSNQQCSVQPLPFAQCIAEPDSQHIYVIQGAGDGDALWSDIDGTWTEHALPSGGLYDVYPLSCPGSLTCFTVGGDETGNNLFETTNGGGSWAAIPSTLDLADNSDLDCYSSTNCIDDDEDNLYVTTDGGVDWTPVSQYSTADVQCLGPTECFNADGSDIDFSSDGGLDWNILSSIPSSAGTIYNFSCTSVTTCVAAAGSGTGEVWSTTNGTTWQNISPVSSCYEGFCGGTPAIFGVAMAGDGSTMYVLGIDQSTGQYAVWTTADATAAPLVNTQPTDQTVPAGSSASFTSEAQGNPTPTVQWQVSSTGGGSWENLLNGTQSDGSSVSGAATNTLSISDAQNDETGDEYRAVFSNSQGLAYSNPATLTISATTSKPSVTVQPSNQSVAVGNSASFSSAASGNPTPTVQWQVSSTGGNSWSALVNGAQSDGSSVSGATTGAVTISNAQLDENDYQYRAIFTNSQGSVQSNPATLTVTSSASVPGAPTDVQASPTNTLGSLDVSWSPPSSDGGASISSYTVTPSPSCGTCTGLISSGTSTTVAGLTNGVSYNFTVTATNSEGSGQASQASTGLMVGFPGAPTDVTATATDGEASLSWSAPTANGGAVITSYTVIASPSCGNCGALSYPGTSAIINGLTNGTSYRFTVSANNSVTSAAGSSGPASQPSTGVTPNYWTGITATINLNGLAVSSSNNCFSGTSDCFSVQQNFWIGQNGQAQYWVQNVVQVALNGSNQWEDAGFYNLFQYSDGSLTLQDCNGRVELGQCLFSYSWQPISFPDTLTMSSTILGNELTIQDSTGTVYTWSPSSGTINSIPEDIGGYNESEFGLCRRAIDHPWRYWHNDFRCWDEWDSRIGCELRIRTRLNP